ncbi:hypothetical protein [Flavobacterium kingsejongi]|uniref:Uncharacterized protein n=1 Tax=Flavobacterium kingsejongi TaxID=1678728 RepID=A0A2S1LKY1_9FLAO|nr:hypothetical protein [Flavobacterium kingsejongi]AWG24405.1 hypothetical protein FK004_03735 [Flavobacterium kingsejongi]
MKQQKLHYSHFVKADAFGVNQINVAALRDKLKLNDNEIQLMLTLESRFSTVEEKLPVLKDGVATGKMVFCDPICIALYYTYSGCEIALKNGLFLESAATNVKELIKSIFNKYDSEKFNLLLRGK